MNKNIFRLDDILTGTFIGPVEQRIVDVVYDSREVKDGDAFVCIAGEHLDGHRYIKQAISNGARTIIGTDAGEIHTYVHDYPYHSFVIVEDSREALAWMAAAVCGNPARSLHTIGVTGTNGKTTVSAFIYSLLNHLECRTGSIGTAGIWDDQQKTTFKQTVPTTPEAPDIQRVLRHFRERDMQAAVIESTSIAMEQKRLDTILFDVAVHTNLTPEHLEFHKTMEAYKTAKMKLFRQAKTAVINVDDPGMSGDLLREFSGKRLTYGMNDEADLRAEDVQPHLQGTSFRLRAFGETHEIMAPVYGLYNVSNLMAAIGACLLLGFPLKRILTGVDKIKRPEGRFQLVDREAPYQIVTDYAHTPDALEKVLGAVEGLPYRRLIVMITGIGLRDPKKRPLMASVVEGRADEIVVSVDQPGHVDRRSIVDDVLAGFRQPDAPTIHPMLHREDGIHKALDLAKPGDVVLLTGIGFGGYQIIGDVKVPYDELAVIDEYFQRSGHAKVIEQRNKVQTIDR
ncbi:UDP-N-acetylmuramoyl-L-alanyl-D-glutamate--2,6-diaminopimelate ligase [Bacillus sp. SB49]|uniref:UDP-N-acetylmuramoyl-L-alanyl-D-glutamate--2, 6-diaminopimelate ligase n=1 Tax=Bacillus sp. SB49 TaxID=1071080 RepID=UPI0003FD3893|nr:UDP-N-acetylmuramoyl-L-alanyl-D-glutamate--2,6-diaminopimelate ligase [Bacillus sp. SB49]QHT46459.1 UDP-N-acetylmuramoyl-L-alanyl-D-glutamate--2,6-diaminopimelate ligase [Bacillus sp. SB49]